MLSDLTLFIKKYTSINLNFHSNIILEKYQKDWIVLFHTAVLHPLEDELKYRLSQHFVIPVTLSEQHHLEIQIDVDKLLDELQQVTPPKVTIPTSRFIINNLTNRQQLLNNPDLIAYAIDYSFDTVTDDPIVVCLSNHLFHFVIDGNHRVDCAIRHDKKAILAYVLSSEFLIATPHLFSDRLSYLLFCFFEDVSRLQIALRQKQLLGPFGILKTEASLLKKKSILPIVQGHIDDTSHQN